MPKRKNYDEAAVTGLFEAQGGLATRAQLIGLGVPSSTIRGRTRADGRWTAVLRGVCADRGRWLGTATETERLRAAVLYGGPEAVVSGYAALRLHGVRGLPRELHGAQPGRGGAPDADSVRLLIPAGRRRASARFVVAVRTRRLPEPVEIDGFRVAPVTRAAVDACLDTSDAERVRELIKGLIVSGDCTVRGLQRELDAHQTRSSGTLRAALSEFGEAIGFRAQRQCLRRLANVAAPPPSWNRTVIEQSTGRIAVLPGALWPEHGVALEVDGVVDAASRERAAARRQWMSRVLRLTVAQVTPSQLRDRRDSVWAELRGLLSRPPTFRLPPGYVLG